MANSERRTPSEESGAAAHPDMTDLMGGVDGGSVDLGDDVNRTASNRGTSMPDEPRKMTGGIDAGNADLGSDVYRDAAEAR